MPFKWKIFRLANYFLLLLSLSITGIGAYFFLNQGDFRGEDLVYFIFFAAGGAVLSFNFSLNIFLLEKYYPDGELQKPFTLITSMMLFLSCITIGFVTLIYAVECYDIVVASQRYNPAAVSTRVLFSLGFGTILLLTYYYVFWMQVALRKTVKRNRQKLYAAFLESN